MKRVLYFYKILFVCLFFLYIFPSCNDASNGNQEKIETNNNLADDTLSLLTAPIQIVGYHTNDGSLEMRVNGSSTNNTHDPAIARRNDVINWQVSPNVQIQIIEIMPDSNYNNFPGFFSTAPHEQGNPRHWQAQIADLDKKGYVEKYWIKWQADSTPTETYKFDPIMQVNPK